MSKSDFPGLELLIRSGRFMEAAAILKNLSRAGAKPWEIYIWLGRIEEERGDLKEAEKKFRSAVNAVPASALPRVELARLLEKAGRAEEARLIIKEFAALAAGELRVLLGDSLKDGHAVSVEKVCSLIEMDIYRKVFIDDVLGSGVDFGRIERGLRVAAQSSPRVDVHSLLAEVLIAQGHLCAAQDELVEAFRSWAAGAQGSRVEALLRLIDRGCYGALLERSVLAAVARARPGDHLLLEWMNIFSALMCARKYHKAFRLGEAVLDKLGFIESPQQLRWPWWRKKGRALSEDGFRPQELVRIRAAGRRGGFPHWFAYYRVILVKDKDSSKVMSEYDCIKTLDWPRYSWMGQPFVEVKLEMRDFDGAIELCERILTGSPSYWWVRCRMAEVYLTRGDYDKGMREFERASGGADPDSRREILSWHGEALLWLGEYASALKKLNEATDLGAKVYVYGWRGAARLKSCDAAGALADLDRALALDPEDFEALCWRGETYRLLGRRTEAIRDLDEVIGRAPDDYWAYFNRGLLRQSSKDARGLEADYAAIPKEVTGRIAGTLGLPRGEALTSAEMGRVLRAGLERAKGVRRWEWYVQNIWMNSL